MPYGPDAKCLRCDATKIYAKNYCANCYQYMRRHGLGRFANRPSCSVEGCSKVVYTSVERDDGLCINHYSRKLWQSNGALVRRSRGGR